MAPSSGHGWQPIDNCITVQPSDHESTDVTYGGCSKTSSTMCSGALGG